MSVLQEKRENSWTFEDLKEKRSKSRGQTVEDEKKILKMAA